jgi:hypothetical protein
LLRCTIFSGRESEMGQFPPPSFVAGMEELTSIPDTRGGQLLACVSPSQPSTVGCVTSATGAPQKAVAAADGRDFRDGP